MTTEIVAIDGPAGGGKSTVALRIAHRLGFFHLDTGAMYRAVTLAVLREGISPNDLGEIARVICDLQIDFDPSVEPIRILLNGEDISEEVREQKIADMVSQVAAISDVREKMVQIQRDVVKTKSPGVVAEGRDIGTVVFPQAKYKFYLDARLSVRAKRRQKDLKSQGMELSLEEIAQSISERDKQDSNRKLSPLRRAEDAILIDTSDLNIEEVIEIILNKVKKEYENVTCSH